MTNPADPQDPAIAGVRIEGGYALIRVPLDRVHGLRVALAECPCRVTKSLPTVNIRLALAAALGKALSKAGL